MTDEKFHGFMTALQSKAMLLCRSKGKDYATQDMLSNFKRMSVLASTLLRKEITPSDIATILLLLKLDRDQNLKDREPGNESRMDTWLDGMNYLHLYFACEVDRAKESKIDG